MLANQLSVARTRSREYALPRVGIAARPAADSISNGGEMLVLTRKTNQSVMIGDDIEVSVLAVSRDKIRLGITAPRDIPVYRREVYLSIKGETSDGAGEGSVRGKVDKALEGLSKQD
jgi:carbon storage regulator